MLSFDLYTFLELKKINDSNDEIINSQYHIVEHIKTTVEKVVDTNIKRYELIPIDILTDWLIDYIKSGCTFIVSLSGIIRHLSLRNHTSCP